jgi:hypothetical protein
MTGFAERPMCRLNEIDLGKSSLIDLEISYRDNKAEGISHRERLSEKTSLRMRKSGLCSDAERMGRRAYSARKSHKSNRPNEQVTLQNQDPVNNFKAGLKPSLIDLEAYGISYGDKGQGLEITDYLLKDVNASAN